MFIFSEKCWNIFEKIWVVHFLKMLMTFRKNVESTVFSQQMLIQLFSKDVCSIFYENVVIFLMLKYFVMPSHEMGRRENKNIYLDGF
jgi:uncharacterized membrane protein YkvA (DUF1232 family)